MAGDFKGGQYNLTKGTSDWEGWGTALKPAHEPVCLARKPLSEKSVAENVMKHGTGGMNIDGCRIETDGSARYGGASTNGNLGWKPSKDMYTNGRFPANLIHDGSDEVMECFPNTKSGYMNQDVKGRPACNTFGKEYDRHCSTIGDSGSASRFFYCAKASKSERDMGCEDLETKAMCGIDKMGGE